MSLPKICTCPTVPSADCPFHHQDACGSLAAMPGSVRQAIAWPLGKFTVYDMPDEHEPCYLVCPDGLMIPFNAHATDGVDQARAQWFADTLNAALPT
jgi:hypothetical protein